MQIQQHSYTNLELTAEETATLAKVVNTVSWDSLPKDVGQFCAELFLRLEESNILRYNLSAYQSATTQSGWSSGLEKPAQDFGGQTGEQHSASDPT